MKASMIYVLAVVAAVQAGYMAYPEKGYPVEENGGGAISSTSSAKSSSPTPVAPKEHSPPNGYTADTPEDKYPVGRPTTDKKPHTKGEHGDKKPGGNYPTEKEPTGNNPGDNNPGDNKPADNTPGDNKPSDNKPDVTFSSFSTSTTPGAAIQSPPPEKDDDDYVYVTEIDVVYACPETVKDCPARMTSRRVKKSKTKRTSTLTKISTLCPEGSKPTPGAPGNNGPPSTPGSGTPGNPPDKTSGTPGTPPDNTGSCPGGSNCPSTGTPGTPPDKTSGTPDTPPDNTSGTSCSGGSDCPDKTSGTPGGPPDNTGSCPGGSNCPPSGNNSSVPTSNPLNYTNLYQTSGAASRKAGSLLMAAAMAAALL